MSQRTLHGTRLKKVRTSGFRARMASKTGRRVINARRKKGRLKLTVLKKAVVKKILLNDQT